MRHALALAAALCLPTSAMAADSCTQVGPGSICNKTTTVGSASPQVAQEVLAECPSGLYATGGGYSMNASPSKFTVTRSEPDPNGRAWAVTAYNTTAQPQPSELSAFVVCRQ